MIRACMILGGDIDSSTEFIKDEINKTKFIVGVDSGTDVLRKINILPDVLIGDLDSISADTLLWINENEVEKHVFKPEKDFTDFHLSMKYVGKKGVTDISILGAFGNREDHFYGNLITALDFSKNMNIILKSENRNCGFLYGENHLDVKIGEIWSFFPFGEELPVISLNGFKYKLAEKTLDYSNPLGVSNISKENTITVTVHNRAPVLYFRYLGKKL